MLSYTSTKSRDEIMNTIRAQTRAYSAADVRGAGLSSWIKGDRFELIYPALSGQPSFCGKVKCVDGKTVITGRFFVNHTNRIVFLVFASVFLLLSAVLTRSLPATIFLLVLLVLGFFGATSVLIEICRRENDRVLEFIERNLL